MLVISGPSCSGKDALLRQLLEARSQLQKPTTTTTREPRSGEVDGQHYHFLDRETFLAKVEQGDFLEHAEVHGHLYGLTRQEVQQIHRQGYFPAVILDVQGAATIRGKMPVSTIFIEAPIEQLKRRMREKRPPEEVEKRVGSMVEELSRADEFEAIIKNPDGQMGKAAQALIDYYDRSVEPRLRSYHQKQENQHPPSPPVLGTER